MDEEQGQTFDYWMNAEIQYRKDEERYVRLGQHQRADFAHRMRIRCLEHARDILEAK